MHLYTVIWMYWWNVSYAKTCESTDDKMACDDKDGLHMHHCDFSGYQGKNNPDALGEESDENTCTVIVKGEATAFMYSCKGASYPWNCPHTMIYNGYAVELNSLFHQCSIDREAHTDRSGTSTSTVLVSHHRQPFVAHCICDSEDGTTYSLRIISGMIGVLPPGFFRWFIVLTFVINHSYII